MEFPRYHQFCSTAQWGDWVSEVVFLFSSNISHQYLTNVQSWNRRLIGRQTIHATQKFTSMNLLQGPKKGLTDARSAVGFCLGSGLFGSYNSD